MPLQIQIFQASTSGEIDAAFAALARERAEALFVVGDAFGRRFGHRTRSLQQYLSKQTQQRRD